jgi:murein peptide amidase A
MPAPTPRRTLSGVAATLAIVAAAGCLTGAAAADAHRVAQRYVLGYSVEHRPIVAWLVGPRHARHTMLVVGSIAGDEPGGIAVTRLLARQKPIAGVSLWLIPDANPDGAARGTRVNAHGVDLNRNFPFRWRHLGARGGRYYSGPRPSSEPESRAIQAFVRRIRPGLAVWLHQPYGLIDDSQGPYWAERRLARALGLPLERLPDYPGSAIGWSDHIAPASAFDVELPGGNLGGARTRLVARAIHSLARRFAGGRSAH